uniref:Neuraminidase 3 n=1 Tax=Aotus nancymaae TaxID=37293 RepID=A0A2K5DZZ8_AOTNA
MRPGDLPPSPMEESPAPNSAQTETEEPGSRAEVMGEVTTCSFNSPLFQQEDDGGITYRIPALLYIPTTHTFLAFAEKRSTSRDEDALHLVLRRGLRIGHLVQVTPHPRSESGPQFLSTELRVLQDLCLFSSVESSVWGAEVEKTAKIMALTECLLCARGTLDPHSHSVS